MDKKFFNIIIILFCLNGITLSKTYYTTNILEPDRIATAWILKHFVDTSASFVFMEKDSIPLDSMTFDLPSSKYRRYPQYSSTMSVIKFHKIKDYKAIKVAQIINEIELDFWAGQKSEKAKWLEKDIREIVEKSASTTDALKKAFVYIDEFANTLEKLK